MAKRAERSQDTGKTGNAQVRMEARADTQPSQEQDQPENKKRHVDKGDNLVDNWDRRGRLDSQTALDTKNIHVLPGRNRSETRIQVIA